MRSFPFRSFRRLLAPTLGLAALACASAPTGPPEQVAPRIVALLDAGKTQEADELFERAAHGDGRDLLYPLLYQTARERFEHDQAAPSAAVLRFMARQYPKARAVHEAFAYALFLQRAELEKPPQELLDETAAVLTQLRAGGPDLPPWVELVQAQDAIDHGDLKGAREALARFHKAPQDLPQDMPQELTAYVQDIDRYLSSHPTGTTP